MKPPLVLAGPGIPAGKTDAFGYLHDLYPTLCELAGAEAPKGLDGKSLLPVIQKKQPAVRDVVFLAYRDGQRAVRQGPWKLLRFPQINHTLLFNLDSDPDEMKNLADDPAQAPRVEAMMELLRKQQQAYGDKLPLITEKPRPAKVDLSFFQ
jgi:arylsulfatase A-like enzyme